MGPEHPAWDTQPRDASTLRPRGLDTTWGSIASVASPSRIQRLCAALLTPAALLLSWPVGAAERPSVAVVGVHGGEGQDDAALRRLAGDLALGFRSAGTFEVLDGEALQGRLAPERDRILDAVFIEPARKLFESGRVLYENAQFDRAIESLHRAVGTLEAGAPFLRDGRLPAEIQLYLGLAYATTNQTDLALEAFTEVVRLDPDHLLDEDEFPPKIVSLFDEVRQEILGLERGTISVARPGARVWVDGRHLGVGPLVSPGLPPGFHTIAIDGAAEGRAFVEGTLAPGQRLEVNPSLLRPTLASAAGDPWEGGRSPLTRLLYESVGRASGAQLVAVAGFDPDGNIRVALWSTRNNTVSAAVSGSLGASPSERSAFVGQLVERLCLYADAAGVLKPDRVASDAPPVRLGSNPVLNDLLFGTPSPPVPVGRQAPAAAKKERMPAGAIVGIVLGAIGAAVAGTVVGVATRPAEEPVGTLTIVMP